MSVVLRALSKVFETQDFTMNLILFDEEEIENNSEIDDENSSLQKKKENENPKQVIKLDSNDYRTKHIGNVLKLKTNDIIEIGIINGKQGQARIKWDTNDVNYNNTKHYFKI